MKFSESVRFKLLVRAFQYRNYRLFFAGQSISLIGTWTQQVAMSWLVYRLTASAFLLGVVAFCNQIPTFFLSPFAGVIADRLNRQRLLLCTQALSMLQAMTLSALVLTDTIRAWQIVGLSLFIGIVNAFDIPARQSFVVEMVEKKEDLGNAIALNSATFNGARFIGPSVAGILISTLGEGICFLLNGISYVAVLIALAAIKVRPRKDREGKTHIWQELCEGVAYAHNFKPIRAILFLLAVFGPADYSLRTPVACTTSRTLATRASWWSSGSRSGITKRSKHLLARTTLTHGWIKSQETPFSRRSIHLTSHSWLLELLGICRRNPGDPRRPKYSNPRDF